jgi:hypothetical protein
MKHSVKHDVGIEMAKKATLTAFDSYKERFAKYRPTATWTDDRNADITFTAKGITLRGTLAVGESSIDMDLDIPFVLRPFKSIAVNAVEQEIRFWVDKAKNAEL